MKPRIRFSLESIRWAVEQKASGTRGCVVNVNWNADDRDLQTFPPSAYLPSDLLQTFREHRVFFIIEDPQVPRESQQELQGIDTGEGALDRRELFRHTLIARDEKQLEHLDEAHVDLLAECIARFLREVVAIAEPCLVYCQHMLDDREYLRRRIQFAHSYKDTISVENLLAAWKEFLVGKRKKGDVQEFQNALMDNVLELHADLAAGRWCHGPYHAFGISDPKPREIHKASVRDRLIHHALYRVLYPFFDRTWISDSYSCRLQKGTHRAALRFRKYAGQVSRNNTRTCWVLKCDIRKFFASIDQPILIEILRSYMPDVQTIGLLEEIIDSFHSRAIGIGLPLGNLTSQLLVNIYMNEFDQFAKHRLKTKYYVRYADDFVVLSAERDELEALIPRISTFLKERLRLSLHPDKVYIKTYASGVDFLGWVHFPDHQVLRTATKHRMVRNMEGDQNDARRESYRGMLSHGNTHKLEEKYLR